LQSNGECQVSVYKNGTKIFWLGYFLRKIMHQENLIKLLHENHDELAKWHTDREIEHFYINKAKELKKAQESWKLGKPFELASERKEKLRRNAIYRQLTDYEIEDTVKIYTTMV